MEAVQHGSPSWHEGPDNRKPVTNYLHSMPPSFPTRQALAAQVPLGRRPPAGRGGGRVAPRTGQVAALGAGSLRSRGRPGVHQEIRAARGGGDGPSTSR